MEKYKEAIHIYSTTLEPLKSIVSRLGLNECSFRQFLMRQFPDLVESRKQRELEWIREIENSKPDESEQRKKAEERERILQALNTTGGNKRNTAKLLGLGKTTLYKKLKEHGIID